MSASFGKNVQYPFHISFRELHRTNPNLDLLLFDDENVAIVFEMSRFYIAVQQCVLRIGYQVVMHNL